MSYSEENEQVVLRNCDAEIEACAEYLLYRLTQLRPTDRQKRLGRMLFRFISERNSGNPNYTPYQVEAKKS